MLPPHPIQDLSAESSNPFCLAQVTLQDISRHTQVPKVISIDPEPDPAFIQHCMTMVSIGVFLTYK